jgi:hypothetical protein
VLYNLSVPPDVLSSGNQQYRIRILVACIQRVYPFYTQLAEINTLDLHQQAFDALFVHFTDFR